MMIADCPLVSVVIPTQNSASDIENCLRLVLRQTYKNLEIIVVDSGTDRTADVARQYGCKVITASASMTGARNIGTHNASGEFLFHIDSDIQLVDSLTIAKCVDLCQSGADAVSVPQAFDGENFWGKCREVEFKLYLNYPPLSGARFVKRKVLENLGGYDEKLVSGEDWDIAEKLRRGRYVVGAAETLMIHGSGRVDLFRRMRKSYQYGKTVKLYARKYPRETAVQWGPSRFAYLLRNGAKLAPKYIIGILLLKAFEFGAGFAGIVSSSIPSKSRNNREAGDSKGPVATL